MISFTPNNHPDVKIPKLIYGTAWKKERSAELVYQAINAGFRAIDTAAQPRHYREDLVAQGIRRAIEDGIVKRDELYIQTKFTPPSGQDLNNMPYSSTSPLRTQVETSLASSFKNFTFPSTNEEPYLDALVLHSPLPAISQTLEVFQILSSYVPTKIRVLGISNTSLNILQFLVAEAKIPPAVVQNRFYADTAYEVPLRAFCRENGILFQSFWTLTGNPRLTRSDVVVDVGKRLEENGVAKGEGKMVALYGLVMGLEGVSVLDGTTNETRMKGDLECLKILSGLIDGEWCDEWKSWMDAFRVLVGQD
ncbi:NADP-dependent oxidoreductase domain-containing protein [Tricladium varicosporioides]|nr:NADP-dependent oxidoreductase domain-containing protein [Hymenoscyphus varicosporioides]